MAVMRVIIAVAIVFAGDMVEQVQDVDAASAVIERVMAGAAEPAVKLDIPLGVDIGTGTSWGAAH